MTGNIEDCLAFELGRIPGVSKVTIRVVTLFSLASKISAKLFRHVLGENIQGVDACIPEVEHSQFFFSLAAVSTFTPQRGFFCF